MDEFRFPKHVDSDDIFLGQSGDFDVIWFDGGYATLTEDGYANLHPASLAELLTPKIKKNIAYYTLLGVIG